MTPFEVVYGIPPPTLFSYVLGTTKIEAMDAHLRIGDQILRDLRYNLYRAQD